MSRPRMVASGIAILGLIAEVLTAARAASQVSSPTRIRLQVHLSVEDELDFGKPGNSRGDEFIARGKVTRPGNTRRIGSFEAVCVATKARPTQGHCTTTLSLGDGEISTQGHSFLPFNRFVNGVSAGTGIYRNARGELHGRSLTPAMLELVYRLLP